MDTQDRFVPSNVPDDFDRDDNVNSDAPTATDVGDADLGEDGLTGAEPETSQPRFKGWQLFGVIAGGVAVAAGIAGVVYLRSRQSQPQTALDKVSHKIRDLKKLDLPKVDLSQAHPRRLSHMAGRRIEQLPVRQLQKRVANKVYHLFD